MKTEITEAQIQETSIYKQAEKVAELVVIPELSKESETYLATLDEYRETLSELNKSAFGRWKTLNAYSDTEDLTEFQANKVEFQEIHKTLDRAEQLHAEITKAVEDGKHHRYIEESTERYTVYQGVREIIYNARKVARAHLEEHAKLEAKREKEKAKAQAQLTKAGGN